MKLRRAPVGNVPLCLADQFSIVYQQRVASGCQPWHRRAADGHATGPILINTAGSRMDRHALPSGRGALADTAGVRISGAHPEKATICPIWVASEMQVD
jgi:hypothetical protein